MSATTKAIAIARQEERVVRKSEERADALSESFLDCVCGGFGAPPGGSIRETQSNYRWMGMNYTQTHRTAYDADGNVVGRQTYRPGSVWSDTTERDASGERNTWDIGGNGLAAQFGTRYDNNGNFSGSSVDARANIGVGDFSLTGNVRSNFDVTRDELGNVGGLGVTGHGDVGVQHDPSGLGGRLGFDMSSSGSISRDAFGNVNGFDTRGGFSAPLEVTHNGETLIGMNLVGANGTLQGGTENGTWSVNGRADFTEGGVTFGGSARIGGNGTDMSFGAGGFGQYQLAGPYGMQARADVGFSADSNSLTGTASGAMNVFQQPVVTADGQIGVTADGFAANGGWSHVPIPGVENVPGVTLPSITVPDLPNIPPIEVSMPQQLPELRANPTGLPGTHGGDEPRSADSGGESGGAPQQQQDPVPQQQQEPVQLDPIVVDGDAPPDE